MHRNDPRWFAAAPSPINNWRPYMKSGYHGVAAQRDAHPREEQSVESRLAELAERWNPLIGEKARWEMCQDVNSLISDEVHRIQRYLQIRPNDTERVENLSELITRRGVFSAIREKTDFREYVQLYVLKLLRSSRPGRSGKTRL